MKYVVLNGRVLEEANAHIALSDRGFRYGDGVFDTLRVNAGRIHQPTWHMDRLQRGLQALRIHFDVKPIPELCQEILRKNSVKDGLLRIQVTRGPGGRGYLPAQNVEPTWVIETLPLPVVPAEPISLFLSRIHKIPASSLPVQFKLCQGLNSTLARMEAADHGCFDALLLNEKGQICETSSANIFWAKGNTVYTPSLACGVLEGSVRAALLRISPSKIHEVEADIDTLKEADGVFICNTAWNILAVKNIEPLGEFTDSAGIAAEMQALLWADINA